MSSKATTHSQRNNTSKATAMTRPCPAYEKQECTLLQQGCSSSFYIREICPITCGTCQIDTLNTSTPTSTVTTPLQVRVTATVSKIVQCPDHEDVRCLSLKTQCSSSFYIQVLCPLSCGTCGAQTSTEQPVTLSSSRGPNSILLTSTKAQTNTVQTNTLPQCPLKEDEECKELLSSCSGSIYVRVKCPISCEVCRTSVEIGNKSTAEVQTTTIITTSSHDSSEFTNTTLTPSSQPQGSDNYTVIETGKVFYHNISLKIAESSTSDQLRIYRESLVNLVSETV